MKRSRHSPRAGSALIIVLAMLVLLTALVLVLLFRVRTDLVLSRNYAGQVSVKTLSESAVNLAIEQIRTGSSQVGDAWISQPGLIRTFDNTGKPVAAYKLYSSDQMMITGAWDPTTDTKALVTDNWASQPNLYVDLNSPVMVPSSTSPTSAPSAVFPIVDGNNMKMLPVGNKTLLTYSTNAGGVPDIEGFGIDLADNNYPVTTDFTASSVVSTTNNPVPMPVKWLYILKDGTLLSATAAGSQNVRVGGGTGPSPTLSNPIVGRIAFWTDDDTCKVDINTAGEGTYWDTPVANSQPPGGPGGNTPTNAFDPDNTYETDLAAREPVANEFQHVPGHPATTCLSTVLGASMRDALGLPAGNTTLTGTNRATLVQAIDNLSPYLSDTNGSIGGTTNTDAGTTIAGTPVSTKSNRRYANADELFYNPPNISGRTPQPLASAANIAPLVAESRFFLTAHSSAPEVNLFGKPRVAIWPVPLTTRTAFDQQIALCSTVGSGATAEPFYFTRSDPTSQTADWTPRNASIYTYLTGLSASDWPGYGGNFASKYPLDYKQIFTEIFDYIRCVNLCDPTPGAVQFTQYSVTADQKGTATSPAQGQVVPILPTGTGAGTRGFGRIATISDLALLMIKEDTRWDQAQAETATLTLNPKTAVPLAPPYPLNYQGPQPQNGSTYLNATRIEFSLIPQLFCPLPGSPPLANNLRFKFSNNTITVTDSAGTTQSPFNGVTEPTLYDVGRVPTSGLPDMLLGGYMGPGILTQAPYGNSTTGAPNDSNFPTGQAIVAGLPSSLSASAAPTLTIKGSVQVDVYAPNGGSTPIQTFQFTFPAGGLIVPIPNLAQNGPTPTAGFAAYASYGTVGAYSIVNGLPYGTLNTATRGARANSGIQIFPYLNTTVPTSVKTGNFDVVRTLELSGANTGGDMRLVSGRASIPSTWFVPQITSTASTAKTTYLAYDFFNCTERTFFNYYQPQIGNMIPGLPSSSVVEDPSTATKYPPLPENVSTISSSGIGGPGVLNSLGSPGDWDNGRGMICDGPYLNKSDEGSIPETASTQYSAPVAACPYFGDGYFVWDYGIISSDLAPNLFIPSRQIPSPVMFGSLPTGVLAAHPWQTLLFRPAKSYLPGGTNHPGAAVPNPVDGTAPYPPYTTPPDSCLLDLFWMPTVQPYPISQPFATSGKINLNFQIAPFTYIERSTGMRAVLKSVKITALNPSQPCPADNTSSMTKNSTLFATYKAGGPAGSGNSNGGGVGISLRRSIDLDKTVQEMSDLYFSANKPFISESQFCDVPLIPLDNSAAGYVNTGIPNGLSSPPASTFDGYLGTFWAKNNLTGDNSLERPYAAIYPRITTKSNTYTVHVWVQTLKQLSGSAASPDPAVFRNGIDQVTGEYRGSFIVERYLDPNTAGFYKNGSPDTGSTPEQDAGAVLGPYKFRILSTRQFNP